jgi:hypothetical protein
MKFIDKIVSKWKGKGMKLKKDGTPRKSGSGRTAGATSLVSVRLADLAGKFGPDDLIVCGRVFLRKAGIEPAGKALANPLDAAQKAGIQVIEV